MMDMWARMGKIWFLACVLFSAGLALGATADCSITVTSPNPGAAYSAYRMMAVADGGSDSAYFYAPTSDWETFFTSGAGAAYVSSDGTYYTWAEGMDAAASMEAFAASAKAYAESLSPTATAAAGSDGAAVTLSGLEAGYYLVVSSSGSKAMVLTTAGSSAEIAEKNPLSTVTLQAQDGGSGTSVLSANLWERVPCRAIITVQDITGPYTLSISMPSSLTYYSKAKIYRNTVSDSTVLTKDTDYTEKGRGTSSASVTILEDYIAGLAPGDQLIVDFEAKLVNAYSDSPDHTLTATVSYPGGETPATAVTIKSFSFEIVKTDGAGNLLDGAQFYLYDAETGGNVVAMYKDLQVGNYRIPLPDSSEAGTTIAAADGKAIVYGLKAGTYYLEETAAPAGYNVLPNRQAVTITDSSLTATLNADGTYASGGVQVVNRAGTVLPATGGMGTAAFYIVGSLLMLAAVVHFIARRRAAEERLEKL